MAYNDIQWNAMEYDGKQCTGIQWSTMEYNGIQYNGIH